MTMVVEVEQMTFGQWLAHLRGREGPSSVARRIRQRTLGQSDLSPQHIKKLEEQPDPGAIKVSTLMLLAEAYWEGNYPDPNAAFWDLWVRAGYALPPGLPPAFAGIWKDPARLAAMRHLMDVIGGWRTDEIEGLANDIDEGRDPDSKRLKHPAVEPPITKLPDH